MSVCIQLDYRLIDSYQSRDLIIKLSFIVLCTLTLTCPRVRRIKGMCVRAHEGAHVCDVSEHTGA